MADSAHSHDNGNFLMGLLLGGIVGAGVAALFTTDSGKRARQRLATYAPELFEDLESLAEALEVKGEELKEKVEEVKELVQQEVEEMTAVPDIEQKMNDLQSTGRGFVQAVNPRAARRFFRRNSPSPPKPSTGQTVN